MTSNQKKTCLKHHPLRDVRFIGPSVLRTDEGFKLLASGTGEVKYGVPSFIEKPLRS